MFLRVRCRGINLITTICKNTGILALSQSIGAKRFGEPGLFGAEKSSDLHRELSVSS